MTTRLSLRLPDSIHKQLKLCAEQDGITIDQFIATAVAEKLASLATFEYLEERARRGNKGKIDSVLAKVPDCEPLEGDEL
jgi:hypothetical protein